MEKKKRCIVCGMDFTQRNCRPEVVPVCSASCREIVKLEGVRQTRTSSYKSKDLRRKPNLADKIYVAKLLHDFRIPVTTSFDFDTVGEMLRWKNEMIKTHL